MLPHKLLCLIITPKFLEGVTIDESFINQITPIISALGGGDMCLIMIYIFQRKSWSINFFNIKIFIFIRNKKTKIEQHRDRI